MVRAPRWRRQKRRACVRVLRVPAARTASHTQAGRRARGDDGRLGEMVFFCVILFFLQEGGGHPSTHRRMRLPNRDPPTQKHSRDTGTPTPERYLKVRPSLDTPLSESALNHPAPRGQRPRGSVATDIPRACAISCEDAKAIATTGCGTELQPGHRDIVRYQMCCHLSPVLLYIAFHLLEICISILAKVGFSGPRRVLV